MRLSGKLQACVDVPTAQGPLRKAQGPQRLTGTATMGLAAEATREKIVRYMKSVYAYTSPSRRTATPGSTGSWALKREGFRHRVRRKKRYSGTVRRLRPGERDATSGNPEESAMTRDWRQSKRTINSSQGELSAPWKARTPLNGTGSFPQHYKVLTSTSQTPTIPGAGELSGDSDPNMIHFRRFPITTTIWKTTGDPFCSFHGRGPFTRM